MVCVGPIEVMRGEGETGWWQELNGSSMELPSSNEQKKWSEETAHI